MRTSLLIALLGATCLLTANADPAHAQAARTWVSGVGDDVNACSRIAPCKTFAGAISKTASAGEINCLDPGGFGAVTITKSITIDCGNAFGSILATGMNGITVNGPNIIVVVRNLSINGAGTGLVGINFINGLSLEVDNVNIHGFSGLPAVGIRFAPNTANSTLQVNDSTITTNGVSPNVGGGILVQTSGGNAVVVIHNTSLQNNSVGVSATSSSGAITMTVRDSIIASCSSFGVLTTAVGGPINLMIEGATIGNNLGTGVFSTGGSSLVRLTDSVVSGNANGVASGGGGVVHSYKNNAINGNANDGTPITPEIAN